MRRIISLVVCLAVIITVVPVFNVLAYEGNESDYYAASVAKFEAMGASVDTQIVSDEVLFGVWNGTDWDIEPLWDYDRYPQMAEIEEAAKLAGGDYTTAKEKLLEYYKKTFSDNRYHYSYGSTYNTPQYKLMAEALMENMYIKGSGMPVARISLDAKEKWVSADVQYSIDNMQSSGLNRVTFMIADLNKDDYMAKLYSKDSSYSPKLEMVVNNSRMSFTADYDTYVKGGADTNTNFGAEDYLYAEESVSSIGAESPIDGFSKRAYISFDLSEIDKTDDVSDAVLSLYGSMTASECTEKDGISKSSMDIMAFDDNTRSFSELSLNWNTTTEDYAFSYDGEVMPQYFSDPTKNAFRWTSSMLSTGVVEMTGLYEKTGIEEYAYTAIRLIINSHKLVGADMSAGGKQHNQPMYQAASRMAYIARVMPTLMKSEYMTAERLTIIIKYIYTHIDWIVNSWTKEGENNNLGILCNKGMMEAAYEFCEFKDFSKPLTSIRDESLPTSMRGGWAAVGDWRGLKKLKEVINPDGTCYEVPLGYVCTAFANFYAPYFFIEDKLCKEVDIQLDDESISTINNVLKYVIDLSNPIGGGWQQGDDKNYAAKTNSVDAVVSNFEALMGQNPLSRWYKTGHESGTGPENLSAAYDTVAKAVMRNSWDRSAVAGQFNADSGQKSHGHMDDLSLNVFAYGKYLICDGNVGSYTSNKGAYNWQRSTRGHNTIEINNTSQKCNDQGSMYLDNYYDDVLHSSVAKATAVGSLHPENREMNDSYDFILGETDTYKDNSALPSDYEVKRSVLFLKEGYFIVTDYIKPEDSEKLNKYSMGWHYYPESNATLDSETKNTTTHFSGEANVVVAPVDDAGEISARIREGLYSSTAAQVAMEYNLYTEYAKEAKGTTTFNTVIYPTMPNEQVKIYTDENTLNVAKAVANSFNAVVENEATNQKKNISYYTLFDNGQKAQRSFGSFTTDGTLAMTEKTGDKYSKLVLRGGTNLKTTDGMTLISSESNLEDIAVDYDGSTLSVSTSKTIDITDVSVYAPSGITTVLFNGEAVSYVKGKNIVNFDPTAEVEPEDNTGTQTPEDDTTVDNNHGTGNGGGGGGGAVDKDKDNKDDETEIKPDEGKEDTVIGGETDKKEFTDTESHWAKAAIAELAEKNIINGYDDGTFKPEKEVTRAELVAMAARVLGGDAAEYSGGFDDVNAADWYSGAVAMALENGIISKDKRFRPEDFVTREEMCKILCNVAKLLTDGIEADGGNATFNDAEDISDWAMPYILQMVEWGYITGTDTGEFNPQNPTTRAHAATVISKIINKIYNEETMK